MSNTSLNRTGVIIATNKSGGAVARGDVVILGSATAKAFTTTTTSGYKDTNVGVVLDPNGIANNAQGAIALSGWVPVINLASSASLYDSIKAHTVAKQGTPHAAPSQAGDFGIALETGTTPSAFLFGIPYPASFDPSAVGITGTLALSGDISPSQITSNQNDYSPTGLSGASVLRLNSDASRDITGLAGGADGRIITIYNTGSQNIVLKNGSASSSAANRFAFQADITLAGGDGCILIYDSTSSFWRCIGKTPGGSGGSSGSLVLLGASVDASASASLDLTSRISATYDKYLLELVDIVPASNNVDLRLQLSSNNGSSWDSSNQWYSSAFYVQNGLSTGTYGDNPNTSFSIAKNINNTAGYSLQASLRITSLASTSLYKRIYGEFTYVNNSGFIVGGHISGFFNISGTAYNAFKLFMSSGNIASGSARLYGIAKS